MLMQLSAPDMERAVAAEERRAYLLPLCRCFSSALQWEALFSWIWTWP